MAYSDEDVRLLRQVETHRTGRGSTTLLNLNNTLLENSGLEKVEKSKQKELEFLSIALDRREKVYNAAKSKFDMWRDHWYMYGSPSRNVTDIVDNLKAEVEELKRRIETITNSPIAW